MQGLSDKAAAAIMWGIPESEVTETQRQCAWCYLYLLSSDSRHAISAILPEGTRLVCKKAHKAGLFIPGEVYTIHSQGFVGVLVRDSKRERKDFNFMEGSGSYFWDYFGLKGD